MSTINSNAPLAAGRLNRKISFQVKEKVRDEDTGGLVYTWVPVTGLQNIPAERNPLSINAFIQAAAMQSKVNTRFRIRKISGINATMRIIDDRDGTVYSIEGMMPDQRTGNEWITILANSGVSDG